jgi:glycosyltransferase involved in cell wall biosynthesis
MILKLYFSVLSKLNAKRSRLFWFEPKLGQLKQYSPKKIVYNVNTIKTLLSSMPSISIITTSYNQASFIERTILSVLNQKYSNLEYGIQDGGSDGTCYFVNKYRNRLLFFETKADKGQSHALNLGFSRTKGEIMAWLNSDDILLPGALHYVANFFNKHPEIDVIYGHRIIIDPNDKEIGRWILPPHDKHVLFWADFIPQESLFWRRRIWEKTGGYIDETYQFAMDWELLLRFQSTGAKFARVPYFLGAFRVHDTQKTSTSISQMGWPEMNRIRKKYLKRDVSQDEIFHHIKGYYVKHMLFDIFWRLQSIFWKECSFLD